MTPKSDYQVMQITGLEQVTADAYKKVFACLGLYKTPAEKHSYRN